MLIIPFTTFLVIWCCSALTCVSSSQVGRNNGFKIEHCKIICTHHIINNIAVSTGYIYQVEKYPQVKSNSWFLIQMISCNSSISLIITPPPPSPTPNFFALSFDNVWERYLDFWCWSFLLMENRRCCCNSFNITGPHCYWTPVQPFPASYLVRIQVLKTTSHHFSVNRYHWHSFSKLSGSADAIQTSLIKFQYK